MARSPSLIARSAQSTPLSTSPHSKKGEDVAHLAVVPLGPEVGAVGCVNPPESPHFRENPAFARLNSCVCSVRRLKQFRLLIDPAMSPRQPCQPKKKTPPAITPTLPLPASR